MELNEKYDKLNLEEVIKEVINSDTKKECITGDFSFRKVSEVFKETDYILSLKGKEILMFQKKWRNNKYDK